MVTPNKTVPHWGRIFQKSKTTFSPHPLIFFQNRESRQLVDRGRVHTPLFQSPHFGVPRLWFKSSGKRSWVYEKHTTTCIGITWDMHGLRAWESHGTCMWATTRGKRLSSFSRHVLQWIDFDLGTSKSHV